MQVLRQREALVSTSLLNAEVRPPLTCARETSHLLMPLQAPGNNPSLHVLVSSAYS